MATCLERFAVQAAGTGTLFALRQRRLCGLKPLIAAIARGDPDGMDAVTETNREAWEAASRKHVREYDDLLAQAASGASLNVVERGLLRPSRGLWHSRRRRAGH